MINNVPGVDTELASSAALSSEVDWLIRAVKLRKKYCRNLRRSLWYSLKDVIGAFGRSHPDAERLREFEFWAVDDVSFELRRGDSLALLGRNGAGKSTLLKLITGQRTLTAGSVETRGRVVALTELGLGFDPVLTGRENAYINAAVHGLSRRTFDELIEKIIDFSELREFIDSAVHSYSTGMKARLGFSVATHLNPDILIVDEVLAVGDLDFRRKCVQHILAYLRDGGSVVLVAHDPYLVQSICNRALILEGGRLAFDGSSVEGVNLHFRMSHANQYANVIKNNKTVPLPKPAMPASNASMDEDATANAEAEDDSAQTISDDIFQMEPSQSRPVLLESISIVPVEGNALVTNEPAKVTFHYRSNLEMPAGWGFAICTRDLHVTIASCSMGFEGELCQLQAGNHSLSCLIPELILQPGVYAIRGGISDSNHIALAIRGYEDAPHYFTVVPPAASKDVNFHAMQNDLVSMKVNWLT